jgi:acyl-CoA synthetase (AMP-forming)/AMP-acid ligase II
LPSAPKAGLAEVDVVDAGTGRSVARDVSTMAEFVFRGACVMLGYLDDDGWFYTGDVGVVHPDGYLRSKDVIISGGENITSVELKSVLYTHPAVVAQGPTSSAARRRVRSWSSRRKAR